MERGREERKEGIIMLHRFGEFALDTASCELRRAGELVAVQRRVFDFLAHMVKNPDRLVKKEELLEEVWGGVAVSEASLAQAVKHARRALGDDADQPAYLLTVRGRGYRFAGAVTRHAPSEAKRESERPAAPRAPVSAPLVGREGELARVEEIVRDAVAGRARVLVVSGEPGIGKTRLLDEIAARAKAQGMTVLSGRCYEGDEGAPALWPWTEILRQAARIDPEGVAALGPELAPDAAPRASARVDPDPLRARFQLFDRVASLLARIAEATPLALAIDDLDRADEASLLLLKLLARGLREARVLIACALRAPVAGTLAEALGAIAREPSHRALPLSGLGEDEVRRFLEAQGGTAAQPELVRAVHARTGGNPFFLTQVVHVLATHAGADAEAALLELLLRSSTGDAIRAHLERLSPACREALGVAAVCGRVFDLGPLAAAAEKGAPAVLALLDEAIAAGIVRADEARSGRFRFVHALVRDALYGAIPLSARVTLHARIGEALAARDEAGTAQSIAEIAYHLVHAAPLGGAARAAEYAVRAAEEAQRAGLHEDAARLYERALEALDLATSDPIRRVEVMLALGNARFRAGDLARSKQIFEQSARLARALGDGDKFADAALGYALEDERSAADQRRIAILEEGLAAISGGSEARRALLTGRLAVAQYFAVEAAARETLGRNAVAAARRAGDPAALAFALRCLHFVLLSPSTAEERSAVSHELVTLARRLDDREGLLRALACRIADGLELGRIAEADADVAAHASIAADLGQPAHQWSARAFRAGRALAGGRVSDAAALLAAHTAPAGALPLLFQLRRAERRLGEIVPDLGAAAARAPERALRRAMLGIASLEAGDRDAARRALEALVGPAHSAIRVDLEWLAAVAHLAEIACALGDERRGAILHDALAPYADRLVLAGSGTVALGPGAHFAGLAASAAGRHDEAVRRLEEAITLSRRFGAPPFEARARLALASACVRRGARGDRSRARELAAEARVNAEQIGHADLAERAASIAAMAAA
jgi:DNA-binding winged helix-turn-helix (wHTH) protein/tetratricopeptide (TPR) repeat protein